MQCGTTRRKRDAPMRQEDGNIFRTRDSRLRVSLTENSHVALHPATGVNPRISE